MPLALFAVAVVIADGRVTTCAQDAQPSVAFFAPQELAPQVRNALEDALATQLTLIQTTLRFETSKPSVVQPSELLRAAKQIAARRRAIAVFWLEANDDAPWLLYATDARAQRLIVRSLVSTHKSSEREANIEAVALLVRATTQALMRAEPLSSTSSVSTPRRDPAPWPVEILSGGKSALRIAIAYIGTTFSEHLPIQDGIALRVAWLMPSGTYVGAGFSLLRPATFNLDAVHFQINRYPISLHSGLRFGFSRVTFIGELGAELEIRTRRTFSAAELEPNRDDHRIIFNICPKLELEIAINSWLVTFLNVGLDLVLDNYAYSNAYEQTMEAKAILEPHWVRFTAQVGIGVIR